MARVSELVLLTFHPSAPCLSHAQTLTPGVALGIPSLAPDTVRVRGVLKKPKVLQLPLASAGNLANICELHATTIAGPPASEPAGDAEGSLDPDVSCPQHDAVVM